MLGSNLALIDKKLFIVLPNMLKSIETASTEVKQIHSRFEPQKTVDKQQFYEDLYSKSSILLRRQDSNLRPIDYTYPKISLRGGLYHHPKILDARRFDPFLGLLP